jgi:hypothetical protein
VEPLQATKLNCKAITSSATSSTHQWQIGIEAKPSTLELNFFTHPSFGSFVCICFKPKSPNHHCFIIFFKTK